MNNHAVFPDFTINSLREVEQLSDIAHRFGHDIGNLLTSIVSFSSVIKRISNTEIEKLPNYSDAILREAWRVSLFNERMVMLLSERSGSPEVTNLEEAISRARHKLRARLNAEVQCNFLNDPSQHYFKIDLDQCTALLLELLLNVSFHCNSEQTAKTVEIQTFENDLAFGFTLTNKIAAVPNVALQTLFQPFTAWPETCKSAGIGLTVAYAIAERAGAKISISTSNDTDPKFSATISFPLSAKPIINNSNEDIEEILEIPSVLPESIKVLLIEDEAVVSSAIEKILGLLLGAKTKLTIQIATGADVFEHLKSENSFDVVLCDLNLKEISGQQIFAHLQKSNPQLISRFAFITGDRGKQSSMQYLESTGRPFLFKPFEPEDLLDLVFELLAENR